MTREEFAKKWGWKFVPKDEGDEWICFPKELEVDLDSLSLPPAEGAAYDGMMFTISEDGINPLDDEQQPTAEGAEEILCERDDAEDFLQTKDIWNHPRISDRTDKESYEVADLMAEFAQKFATLHAQKLADKMGGEMLRDEKAFTDWYINHVEIESREEKYIIDNETTIYSFSDLMDYWNRYLKQRQPWMTTA